MMVSAENDPRRSGTIWMHNLDEPAPVITPLVDATFRRAGPESILALAEAMGSEAQGEILERFETGRRCYAAWVDGQLVTYGWVSFEEELIGELGLRVRLLPGEAYIWDCATVPAFRRFRLYSALLGYILEVLRSGGWCRVWIGADLENVASHRGIDRAGFRRVADLLVARQSAQRLAWIQGYPGVPENLVAQVRRAFLDDREKVWLDASSQAPR